MARRTPAEVPQTVKEHTAMTDDMLESMQDDLNKEFGNGSAQRLSSAEVLSKIDHWVSTKSMVVDAVLRGSRPVGSSLIPFGRQTEISGLPGTGKTTLCAQIAAEVQRIGGTVVVTDTEERIDHHYWSTLGVDTDRIINLTARTLEEVFERQLKFIQLCLEKWPNRLVFMLWDSLGGTSSDDIMDIATGDSKDKKNTPMEKAKKAMMHEAKVIGAGMKLINPFIAKSKVAYVYTNTLYMMPDVDYGDPYETPGGTKKNFYATLRLRLKRVGQLVEEDETMSKKNVFGHKVEIATLKNSMAPSLMAIEGAVIGGLGFSNEFTVRKLATALGAIVVKGAWSTWTTPKGEEVKFMGWRGFLEKAVTHPEYPDLVAAITSRL